MSIFQNKYYKIHSLNAIFEEETNNFNFSKNIRLNVAEPLSDILPRNNFSEKKFFANETKPECSYDKIGDQM